MPSGRHTSPPRDSTYHSDPVPSDVFDDGYDSPTLVRGLTQTQLAWQRLLTIIASDFPTSEYAKLAPNDLNDLALGWCDRLPNVAAGQVNALYGRLIRDREDSFPPNLGELAKAWNLWQREECDKTHTRAWNESKATIEPDRYTDQQPSTNLAWAQRMREHKGVVACHCTYRDGTPVGASLRNMSDQFDTSLQSPTHWVCTSNQCDFRIPASQTATAKTAAMGPLGAAVTIEPEPVPESEPVKPSMPKLTYFEQVCRDWEIDVDNESELALVQLRMFVNRWQATQSRDRRPTPDDYQAHQQAQKD